MTGVRLTPLPNGPYQVTGDVELVDREGRPFETPLASPLYLCRCGRSAQKPFCDGAHARTRWNEDACEAA